MNSRSLLPNATAVALNNQPKGSNTTAIKAIGNMIILNRILFNTSTNPDLAWPYLPKQCQQKGEKISKITKCLL